MCACLDPGADIVALVKPQFEVGRSRVGKGGIVRDPALWDDVLEGLVAFAADHDLGPAALARSTLPGAEGNIEFFLHLRPGRAAASEAVLAGQRHQAVHGA